MRAKHEAPGGAELGSLIKGALGDVIGEAVKSSMAEQLPRALAVLRMPARPADPEYIDRKEAARITGYHERTIARHIAMGTLQASGLGGDRIVRAELDRWMAAMAKGTRRPAPAAPEPANEAEEISAEVDRLLNDDE